MLNQKRHFWEGARLVSLLPSCQPFEATVSKPPINHRSFLVFAPRFGGHAKDAPPANNDHKARTPEHAGRAHTHRHTDALLPLPSFTFLHLPHLLVPLHLQGHLCDMYHLAKGLYMLATSKEGE